MLPSRYLYVASLLLLFFLPTCKKEPALPNYNYKEQPAHVDINGQPGIFKGAAFKSDKTSRFRLSITQYNQSGGNKGSLSIYSFEGKAGFYYYGYQPSNENTISYFSGDGDILGDSYHLLADSSAWIAIDSIDKKRIWGRFEAHLVKDSLQNPRDLYAPDTLHLTTGKFQFDILKDWE
jgi:hypothetical protein